MEADLSLPSHAQAVLQLLNEYALDEMGGGAPLPAHVQTHLVAELHKRPQVHVVLAFVSDAPVGMAICMEGFSSFACQPLLNIHDIVVTAPLRGQGLSRRLLQKAEDIALRLGCCKMTLEVLEGNTAARAAYARFGFAGYELDPAKGKALFWQKKLAAQ